MRRFVSFPARKPSPATTPCRAICSWIRRRGRLAVLVVLLLAASLTGSLCRAESGSREDPGVADLTGLTLEELMGIEIDTVSAASRYEQPVTEAPASVSIVTADEIRQYGYRNLADILQGVRGFSVINDRNYQYAGIRGFGFPGDYGSRMLLLVDGVRQNDYIYQSFFVGNEFILDVDLIERVEIIRGPSFSLYGANAMLGVVNVITKKGRDLDGVELSGEAGSFDAYKGRLSYGRRFAAGPELLLSGSLYDARGQDLFFPEFAHPSTNYGWAGGCDGERYGSGFLKLIYRDLTLEGAYGKRGKTIPTAPWDTVFNASGTRSWDSGGFIDLKYRHTFADELDLMARVSYHRYGNDGRYLYNMAEPDERPFPVANIDYSRASWLAGETQLTALLFDRHRLIGGVEFLDVLSMLQQNRDLAVNLDDRRTAWNIGAYIQDEYQVLDDLILNAGIRYDHFDSFGGTVNPRIALIYSPLARTSLKFLFGTGFRAPNGYELYYGDGSTMKPNHGLREERSTSYEFVLERYFGRHFRGTVAGYYTRVKDLITQVVDPSDGMLTFVNVAAADLKGVELELGGKWDNGLEGRISYSYQDGKDSTTGGWLPNSPRHLAKLNLVAPVFRDTVFLGLEEQYTGAKQTLNGSKTGDYFITNLTLFSRNLPNNLEISGSVYNLFNTGYSVPGGGEHVQNTIRQDGRSFRVKMTWRF